MKDRDKSIIEFLEKHGKPATYGDIHKGLPREYRMAHANSTHAMCCNMEKRGELKVWRKKKTVKLYGLPDHEEPSYYPPRYVGNRSPRFRF